MAPPALISRRRVAEPERPALRAEVPARRPMITQQTLDALQGIDLGSTAATVGQSTVSALARAPLDRSEELLQQEMAAEAAAAAAASAAASPAPAASDEGDLESRVGTRARGCFVAVGRGASPSGRLQKRSFAQSRATRASCSRTRSKRRYVCCAMRSSKLTLCVPTCAAQDQSASVWRKAAVRQLLCVSRCRTYACVCARVRRRRSSATATQNSSGTRATTGRRR